MSLDMLLAIQSNPLLAAGNANRTLLRLLAPTEEEKKIQQRLTLWRLYWLHRGRLCSPFKGDLEPSERVSVATCTSTNDEEGAPPAEILPLGCPPDNILGPQCVCGFYAADNMAALSDIIRLMVNEPWLFRPLSNRAEADGMEDFDWPVPALVRVEAEHCRRSERWARIHEWATRTELGRRYAPQITAGSTIVWERFGVWRARKVTIIGLVLTGEGVRGEHPDPRDVADFYRVRYAEAGDLPRSKRAPTAADSRFFKYVPHLVNDNELPAEMFRPYA